MLPIQDIADQALRRLVGAVENPNELLPLPPSHAAGVARLSHRAQYYVDAWISPAADRDLALEAFDAKYLDPMMRLLARDLPRGRYIAGELELPKGCEAASARVDAWSIRVALSETLLPPEQQTLCGVYKKAYSFLEGEFVFGKACPLMRIDILLQPAPLSGGHQEDERVGHRGFPKSGPVPRAPFPRSAYIALRGN